MASEPVHFSLGFTVIDGTLVEQIGSGVVTGRIDLDGGRTSALLVETAEGGRAVRHADLRRCAPGRRQG